MKTKLTAVSTHSRRIMDCSRNRDRPPREDTLPPSSGRTPPLYGGVGPTSQFRGLGNSVRAVGGDPEHVRDAFVQAAPAVNASVPAVDVPDAVDQRHGERRHGSDDGIHGTRLS